MAIAATLDLLRFRAALTHAMCKSEAEMSCAMLANQRRVGKIRRSNVVAKVRGIRRAGSRFRDGLSVGDYGQKVGHVVIGETRFGRGSGRYIQDEQNADYLLKHYLLYSLITG